MLCKNDEFNPQVIKRKIRNYERKIRTLRNILRETEDKEFYLEKIKFLEKKAVELHEILETKSDVESKSLANQEKESVNISDVNMTLYLDELVRNIIKHVIINNAKIKVEFL